MELSATQKVLAALRKDKKRVTKKISTPRKRAFAKSVQSDTDTDSEDDTAVRQRAKNKLQNVVRKIIKGIRDKPHENGVSLKDLADRYRCRFEGHPLEIDGEEKKFVLELLRADPLMFKVTMAIERVQRSLELHRATQGKLIEDDEKNIRQAGLNSAVEAVYKMKVFTARHLWSKEIEPLRDKLDTLGRLHESLKNRFNDTRAEYLKEVSELRDAARGRTLPGTADDTGVKLFFDPVTALNEQELTFMTEAISEKLKMIFEHDPNVKINPSQLQAMLGKQEGNELRQLRATIEQRDEEVKQLKAKIKRLEMGLTQAVPASTPAAAPPGANNKMIQLLEEQVEDLRAQIREDQSAAKKLLILEPEHEDLQRAYDAEIAERLHVQAKLEATEKKVQEAEEGKAEVKKCFEAKLEAVELEKQELTSQVSRQQKALDVASKRRSVRAKTRKITLDASKFDSGLRQMSQLAEDYLEDGGPEVLSKASRGTLGIVGTATAAKRQSDNLPDACDEDAVNDALDALDVEEQRDNQLLATVKEVERNNKRLAVECAKLKTENSRLRDEVHVQTEALAGLRTSQAKQFAASALDDIRQLKMMVEGSNPPSPIRQGQGAASVAAQLESVKKLEHEVKFLQEQASSMVGDLEFALQEAGPDWEQDAEKAMEIQQLHQQVRQLKFQTFSHEAQLETARSSLEIADGRSSTPSSGRALSRILQDMQDGLIHKLEDSANANVVMVNWVNDTQRKSKDIIRKLWDYAANMREQTHGDEFRNNLSELEGVVYKDALAGDKPSFDALVERLHKGCELTQRQLSKRNRIIQDARVRNEATAKLDTMSKPEGWHFVADRPPRSNHSDENDNAESQRPWSTSPPPEITPPAKRATIQGPVSGVSRTEMARRAARIARKEPSEKADNQLQDLRPMSVQMQRQISDTGVKDDARRSSRPSLGAKKSAEPELDDLTILPPVVSPTADRRHSGSSFSPSHGRTSPAPPEKIKKRAHSSRSIPVPAGPDTTLSLSGGGFSRQASVA
eukprot:TRINITY_DN103939_c0_g1_i1.p1 TRINITY_DN103939_c0_g1~~TRINITY_DN103939_c0_g1_i1.p1  ORF type:complete len:1020 (+),score=221.82 TRINITY_DN103939_c0_g1_i1:79-3138(+)